MAVSMKQVRAFLDCEEPDYPGAAETLGAGAATHLAKLADSSDPLLASKAVYLASLIGTEKASSVVEAAARHTDPTVRIASAAGARNLNTAKAEPALSALIGDADQGVRKAALRAVDASSGASLRAQVGRALDQETDNTMREITEDALQRMSGSGANYTPGQTEDDSSDAGFGGGEFDDEDSDGAGVTSRSAPSEDDDDEAGQGGGEITDADEVDTIGADEDDDAAGMGGGG